MGWIKKNTLSSDDLAKQRKNALSFLNFPKFSIIVPTYNTDETMLIEMIESVSKQTYPNWELCIADGGSDKPYIIPALESYAQRDKRIKYTILGENRGISGNTNAALALADGDYIALLDHDDMLAEHALYVMAAAINKYPGAGVLYSDEDKFVSTKNAKPAERFGPHFKSGWNPELLHSCNYISHFLIMQSSIVREIGGFRTEFDGSQDYDIILRATEKSREIVHIPDILYHWRVHAKSVAGGSGAKQWAFDAGVRTVQDSFERNGVQAATKSRCNFIGHHDISISLSAHPLVSVIVMQDSKSGAAPDCTVGSIISGTLYDNYEIIVFSTDNGMKESCEKKGIKMTVLNQPGIAGMSAAEQMNFAAKKADGKHLLFISADIRISTPLWIDMLLQYSQNDAVGCTGAKVVSSRDRIVSGELVLGLHGAVHSADAGLYDSEPGYMCRAQDVQNVSVVSNICFMIQKELFVQLEGMNEKLTIPYATMDLCLRALADSKRNVYNPSCKVLADRKSLRAGAGNISKSGIDYRYMQNKWAGFIQKDPYYNPNFSLSSFAGFRIENKKTDKAARVFAN